MLVVCGVVFGDESVYGCFVVGEICLGFVEWK